MAQRKQGKGMLPYGNMLLKTTHHQKMLRFSLNKTQAQVLKTLMR